MRRRGLALPGVEELALDDAARDLCVAQLSREVALLCRRDGVVSWADGRADRVLGAVTKLPLSARAVPGTEAKVSGLVARACDGPVEGFELSLLAFGRPATFAFSGVPCADGAMLVGRLLAEDVAKLGEVSAAMAELGELHRETQRQKREISRQNDDLARANRELSDSNRALLTMHAVLDDKNDALRHASDVKTRVVANVSHEFRTPINSILGLSQLLLDRLDGELTAEQEKQVRFVRSSAETLSVLVNDLLDLSRIEAGRHELRATEFDVAELLSSLRGMMKPLVHPEVDLVVDEPAPLPRMHTDAGKLSQILRNLVSNAIKFTTRGVIRVRALPSDDGRVRFEVSDTGIGIASADHDRVFEEFTQIDSPVQSRVQGSGLGLHLSRKFAELLGGSLTLRSELGEGSTFVLEVPVLHEEVATVHTMTEKAAKIDASKRQVLVVEDNRQTLFFYERYLSSAGFQVIPARTVDEARAALARLHPAAIVLDVMLEGEVTWSFLAELKEGDATRDIPVMVVTVVDRAQKARALGADEFWLKPVDGDRMIRKLAELAKRGSVGRVLVIDDDEAARYMVRKLLASAPYTVFEAADGATGVELARTQRPDVIFLDFLLQNETAFDVLDDLKADPSTRSIPIIIQTAKTLDDTEREKLERETAAILAKQSLSREIAITRIREALEASGLNADRARTL
ncbi:MAG: response regulator [Labilithrix sp.]|nr:response regulator [Labilithrix sp.]